MKIVEKIKELGYEAVEKTVAKNGIEKTGIAISVNNSTTMPIIYYDDPVFDIADEDELVNTLIEIAKENTLTNFDGEFLAKWEEVKNCVYLCLRPQTNDSAVKTPFLDLDCYVRAVVQAHSVLNPTDNILSVVITDDLLNTYGITKEELFSTALNNQEYTLSNFMMLNVASNTTGTYGASAIADQDFLADAYNRFGAFYILPSSIHEVLIAPETEYTTGVEELRTLVREVNDTEVDERDRLSYNIYYYDGENLSICE